MRDETTTAPRTLTLSLNTPVTFRPTEEGVRAYDAGVRALGLDPAGRNALRRNPDGTVTWPLWDAMRVFGPYMVIGLGPPLIEHNELTVPVPPDA